MEKLINLFSCGVVMAKEQRLSWKVILLIVITLIILFIHYNKISVVSLIKKSPALWPIYSYVQYHITKRTLTGMFYAVFLGSLFFIVFPLEIIYLYYLYGGYNVFEIAGIYLVASVLGLLLDYLIGLLFGERILRYLFKDKLDKFQALGQKYGGFFVFIGNMLIFPIQYFSLLLGSLRYSFKKFLFYTIVGIIIKLVILTLWGSYILSNIVPWFTNIF